MGHDLPQQLGCLWAGSTTFNHFLQNMAPVLLLTHLFASSYHLLKYKGNVRTIFSFEAFLNDMAAIFIKDKSHDLALQLTHKINDFSLWNVVDELLQNSAWVCVERKL